MSVSMLHNQWTIATAQRNDTQIEERMSQYRHHPLTEAARNNDAIAEERGLEATLKHLGIDMKAVMHIASQRAMRLTILISRGEAELKKLTQTNVPMPVRLTPAEEAICGKFTLAVLDGICIGWKGRQIEEANAEGHQ